jgi:hypothetical protein
MIEQQTLPQPQWMALGKRVERVYTQEWLLLAMDALRERHLFDSQLKSPFVPRGYEQFAIRYPSSEWTLEEIVSTLAATNRLWQLCNSAVGGDNDELRQLPVRRLSAGSPMDILVTIQSVAHSIGGPGAAAALLIWVLKNPEKVVSAVPRAVAEWREQWTRVTRAGTNRQRAKLERTQFETEAAHALKEMKGAPTVTGLATNDPKPLALSSDTEARPRQHFLTAKDSSDGPEQRAIGTSK